MHKKAMFHSIVINIYIQNSYVNYIIKLFSNRQFAGLAAYSTWSRQAFVVGYDRDLGLGRAREEHPFP